jgi:hypothetical protein
MALAILLLHHAHRPLPEIDRRTLGGLQERIRVEQFSRRRALLRILHQALCDNVLEDMRERVTLRQPGGRLEYDLLQQVEDTLRPSGFVVVALALDAEGEFADRQLHQRQANTPNVALNRVRAALNSLWCHVCARANECVSHAVFQLAAYAKVAELDFSFAVDQNI